MPALHLMAMRDRFEFESPLGTLGRMADWLFLVRRNAMLKQLAESAEWRRYLERGQSEALHSRLNRVAPGKTKNSIL